MAIRRQLDFARPPQRGRVIRAIVTAILISAFLSGAGLQSQSSNESHTIVQQEREGHEFHSCRKKSQDDPASSHWGKPLLHLQSARSSQTTEAAWNSGAPVRRELEEIELGFSPRDRLSPTQDPAARIQDLYTQSQWQQVVDELKTHPPQTADLAYYYGSALAHLEKYDEARQVLLKAERSNPRDTRFPTELAGVAFKQSRYPEAAKWLHKSLRLNPGDTYSLDFLATIYFLEGNIEAALKYWNRVHKPQLHSVKQDHALKIRPELLDHALAFAPSTELDRDAYLTSQARLTGLEIFSKPKISLAARDDGTFDALLDLDERNGFGNSKWSALLSAFRGIGYETIYPEYFNLHGTAMNITSLVRFDSEKRRLAAEVSAPLRANPKWRYRIGVDLRNENWAIRDSFAGVAPKLGALNLRREAASVEVDSFNSGRWGWSAAVELSHRDYRSVDLGTALTPGLLLEGMQLKQISRIHYDLWRLPEHRLVVKTDASSQLARIWSSPTEFFAKEQGGVAAEWFPKAQGDDYLTQVQVRGGGIAGDSPFDELYMLGLERDNDLLLRAHIGTRDGLKGSAPLGRRFLLINGEVDKNVYRNGFVTVKLSPFLDNGRIRDDLGTPGESKWLWDTGLQAKLRVLGFGLNFTWGKDLRTGDNAFYFTAAR